MLFSKLFLAALAPVGLLADSVPGAAPDSDLDLDALLAKHNLVLVPRSDLAEVLTELNGFLKKSHIQQRNAPLYPRQSNGTGNSGGSSGSDNDNSQGSGSGQNNDQNSGQGLDLDLPDIPGLGDLGKAIESLTKLVTQLGDIGGYLEALQGLLSDDFLKALHDAMVYLAATLRPPIPDITRNILTKTEPLIELLGSLDLKGIIGEIEDIDLKGILNALSPLLKPDAIKSLVDLLNNASSLLTKEVVDDLKALLTSAQPLIDSLKDLELKPILDALSPLLKPESIKGLVDLLNNAGSLLTADTVKTLKSLLSSAQPLIDGLKDIDLQGLIDQISAISISRTCSTPSSRSCPRSLLRVSRAC